MITLKFGMPLGYALGRFVFEFHKNQMGDDVSVKSYKFSPNKCPYFKFYWIYKPSLLVQTFNNIKYIYWLKCKWSWQTLMVKGEGQRSHKINKWSYLLCIYLLLFVCPYILIEQDFFVYVFIVIFYCHHVLSKYLTCFCHIFIVLQKSNLEPVKIL